MPQERDNTKKEAFLQMIQHAMDRHYSKDAEGQYYVTPYVSYDDNLSEESIRDILTDPHPHDRFFDKIFNAYLDYTDDTSRDILIADLKKSDEFQALQNIYDTDLETELDDYIREHVYTAIPYEHYLQQEIQLNIIVDTGDLNTDFTENNLLNYYAPDYSNLEEGEAFISDSSSLLWLCQSQGICKKELQEAILNGTAYQGEVLDAVKRKNHLEQELEKLGKDPYGRYHKNPYQRYLTQKEKITVLERKQKQVERTHHANSITFLEYQNLVKKKNLPMPISNEADFLEQQKQILSNLKDKINTIKEELKALEKPDPEVEMVKKLSEALTIHMQETYNPLQKTDAFQKMQFLESVLQESRESTTHMNALTFCVKMPLEKAIQIQELINKEKEYNNHYDASERCGNSVIVLDKNVSCGLYDSWNGAGGLFDIQPITDIELPIKYIQSMNIDGAVGYSLQSIYGRGDAMWTDSVKDVIELEPGRNQPIKPTRQTALDERISMIQNRQEDSMEVGERGNFSKER